MSRPLCPFVLFLSGLLLWMAAPCLAQPKNAAEKKAPDPRKVEEIKAKLARLGGSVIALKRQGLGDPWLADVEIHAEAVSRLLAHNEFYTPAYADWALDTLDRGLLRARLAAQGEFPWANTRGSAVVRAYRSRVDGSLQPFAVTLPRDYGQGAKKWRVDVVLHGRDNTLNEVKFLHRHNGEGKLTEAAFVQIEVFGRGNNAYRWAGERDVLEALHAFAELERQAGRGQLLDERRVVLRGFSMGGAGAWHIGLHYPDRWCVVGPGAGFTTTRGYAASLPEPLPGHQARCLHIYDAVDYAENALNVPVVAYAGSEDTQLRAALNVQEVLKPLGLADRLQVLVAPGLGHQFPPEWQQQAEKAYAPHVRRGTPEWPERVRFVTYTLKYPSCHWVEILGLDEHYRKTLVEAERSEKGVTVTTANVRLLHLKSPASDAGTLDVTVDGQRLQVRPWVGPNLDLHVYLEKADGGWRPVLPQMWQSRRLRGDDKWPGLQGPVDDAFTDAFLCVRGTGKPWHEATGRYADARLQEFAGEWSKWWRGELPVKDDVDVTDADIAGRHLILFGDPASNSLIGQVVRSLPLRWTPKAVEFAGKAYGADAHLPVLIYPNPLNPHRYVVLNSGHTFHEDAYAGTNALLYPRLGDYAVLRLTGDAQSPLGTEVVTAGLFDDCWQVRPDAGK